LEDFIIKKIFSFAEWLEVRFMKTLDHVIVARDENYINDEVLLEFRVIHDKTLKILNGYIAYLKRSKLEV